MKRYANSDDLRRDIAARISKKGFRQKFMDEFHVQVLQDYRIAAAFVIAILGIVEVADVKHQELIKKTIAECEEVFRSPVFVMTNRDNPMLSKQLKEMVEKADVAIAHAGNLCNNFIPGLMPKKVHSIVLRARDICDGFTRRIRFS